MIFLQIYTMEITLGVFAFLLLLGVIAILAFLGIYRLNDARAYARYVALKYIAYNYTHRYELLAHVCRHNYIFTYLFQVPESERQCKVCSKPKQFIQVSGINFSKPNVWKGSNELNKHYIFEQLHSFTITVLLKNVDTCKIKSSKCDILVETQFSLCAAIKLYIIVCNKYIIYIHTGSRLYLHMAICHWL